MRDPFTWALPIGRIFGITVRLHILFILFVLVMWLRTLSSENSREGEALWMMVLMGLLFFSVLLHEFGHCFAARYVDGDADEVLLVPFGGLARCDLPHSPWAHFVTAAAGPFVNLMLCVAAGAVLMAYSFQPSLNPLPEQCWNTPLVNLNDGLTYYSHWATNNRLLTLSTPIHLTAQFFWLNWASLLLNVLLMGFPLDGGRMLQSALWPRLGYRSATRFAIVIGFVVMFVVGACALLMKPQELMLLCLAGFIYISCKQEWINLELGGEESLFGYDFSQGYTSLERDQPLPPRKKQPNFLQRWLKQRAAKKQQLLQEQQEADESRMDALLEKIAREGKQALTDEENRFLKRVSDRYRNRN